MGLEKPGLGLRHGVSPDSLLSIHVGKRQHAKTEEVLAKGLKCCLDVKPSRLDVLSTIHTVARKVNPEEKQ